MAKIYETIHEAIENFDLVGNQEWFQNAEKERQEILNRFPLSKWPTMPLEEYALGLPDSSNTYCWWLEFNSPHLGSIKGGSATKHLVYKRKNKPGWYYYPPTMADENEAWQAIRGDFVKAFELAEEGNWEKIDELPYILGARAVRGKTLFVYFPNEIIPVHAIAHIRHFLELLGAWEDEMSRWESITLNRKLLSTLRSIPEIGDWSTVEIAKLLYYWAHPRETKRIVKIAPGENAVYWDDCVNNGYICVGWDKVGDLREYQTFEEFKTRFSEIYPYNGNKAAITKKSKEVWTLMELEPGDIIIANDGISKIKGIGEVVDPGYLWSEERSVYRHIVKVEWDVSYEQIIEPQQKWSFSTVQDIPVSLFQRIISKKQNNVDFDLTVDRQFTTLANALERKGQIILYGPPGTGKTYIARRFSVWWLTQNQNSDHALSVLSDEERFKKEERKLTTTNLSQRIWWIVANPAEWSWHLLFEKKKETFRYGRFQRNYPLVQPGDLVIGYQARPDKKIVAMARISKSLAEMENEVLGIEIEPLVKIHQGPTYEELQNDIVMKNSEPIRNRCQGTLFALSSEEAQYVIGLISENQPDVEKFITTGEGIGNLTWLTFHPSYSYEDFVEGYRPIETSSGLVLKMEDGIFKRICREAQAHPKQKYLIVIDEINRANIAKVFGELITLIEKDKRTLIINLPQSKETFTIPSNVYILGTMNTADRSIKIIDIALRRRFSFFEIMPNSDLLQGAVVNGLNLDLLLEALNKRIALYEGREKQIGHALLMSNGEPIKDPEEFAERFRQDILPLLQEYCYEDYASLERYIGSRLVDSENNTLNTDIINNDEALIESLIDLVVESE
jgi:5-methylcytosine-specific restriction enzyme B